MYFESVKAPITHYTHSILGSVRHGHVYQKHIQATEHGWRERVRHCDSGCQKQQYRRLGRTTFDVCLKFAAFSFAPIKSTQHTLLNNLKLAPDPSIRNAIMNGKANGGKKSKSFSFRLSFSIINMLGGC